MHFCAGVGYVLIAVTGDAIAITGVGPLADGTPSSMPDSQGAMIRGFLPRPGARTQPGLTPCAGTPDVRVYMTVAEESVCAVCVRL